MCVVVASVCSCTCELIRLDQASKQSCKLLKLLIMHMTLRCASTCRYEDGSVEGDGPWLAGDYAPDVADQFVDSPRMHAHQAGSMAGHGQHVSQVRRRRRARGGRRHRRSTTAMQSAHRRLPDDDRRPRQGTLSNAARAQHLERRPSASNPGPHQSDVHSQYRPASHTDRRDVGSDALSRHAHAAQDHLHREAQVERSAQGFSRSRSPQGHWATAFPAVHYDLNSADRRQMHRHDRPPNRAASSPVHQQALQHVRRHSQHNHHASPPHKNCYASKHQQSGYPS